MSRIKISTKLLHPSAIIRHSSVVCEFVRLQLCCGGFHGRASWSSQLGRGIDGLGGGMTDVKNSKHVVGTLIKNFHKVGDFFLMISCFCVLNTNQVVRNV